MALTKVTSAIIKSATITGANIASGTVTGANIASGTVTHANTDSSIAKVVTLTQAQYDALSSYDASTLYITT